MSKNRQNINGQYNAHNFRLIISEEQLSLLKLLALIENKKLSEVVIDSITDKINSNKDLIEEHLKNFGKCLRQV